MSLDVKERINELVTKLNYYSKQYYTFDKSLISDYEYDMMYKELLKLESQNKGLVLPYSPTKRVGDVLIDDFKKIKHLVKMDSLQDVFNDNELIYFLDNIRKEIGETDFVVERKIDGLSVTLTYENGIFTSGATRGDGFVGEDVTENLKTIKTIPLQIDTDVSFLQVRGEVYMPLSSFNNIVKEQKENGKEVFKNPRNAAAGSLRQKDSKVVAKRNLDIFVFNLQKIDTKIFKKHSDSLIWLKKIGFKTSPEFKVIYSTEEIVKEISNINKNRNEYDYDIDGAVIKVNNINDRIKLGSTDKVPKWSVAFKYPPEEKTAKILDITVNVGRTGAITPTAIFTDVLIAGSNVSRAVLHNQDFIDEKKIAIGDIVSIRKAGDIIPEVVRVVEHKGENDVFKIPILCPSCGEKTVKNDGESAVRCINKYCPEKNYRSIVHFCSRDCMNIDGLGARIVKTLMDKKLIYKIEDLYKLSFDNIISLDGFKEKSTNNLLNSIEESKKQSFSNLLFSFGISNIGKKASKLLVEKFGDIDTLLNATVEDITNIDGFGNVMAESIVDSLKDKRLLDTISALRTYSLNFSEVRYDKNIDEDNFFYNKTFVVTGTLHNYKRKEVEDIIALNGGKISSSVSKNTNYLICGDNAGSKLKKATEYGVKVINEQEFIKINDIGE